MARVLVVDDESEMRNLLHIYLRTDGHSVEEANDGFEALDIIRVFHPDVIILDVMMPGMDGFEACSFIREQNSEIPILMLTARTSVEDKVSGLSRGADDYLAKPFDGRELIARVRALYRRAYGEAREKYRIDGIDMSVDLESRTVSVGDVHLTLTPKEFELLVLLTRHPGRTFPRDEILERVWNGEYEGETRTVDSHVKNIREKLREAEVNPNPIKTVWGVGYKFEVKP
jgi:two-component system, OmpR family, response regulator ResD